MSEKECLIIRRHPAIDRGYDRGIRDLEVSGYKLQDLTSTTFNWLKETPSYRIVVEERIDEYIEYITDCIKEDTILVISSHQVVKNKLDKMGIKTIAVYPDIDKFKDFAEAMKKRETKDNLEYQYVNRHWFPYVREMKEDTIENSHIEVYDAELTLLDIINAYLAMYGEV